MVGTARTPGFPSTYVRSGNEIDIYLSVVIRARNEAKVLSQVFDALAAQRCAFPWEIVVVDNDSEDDTVGLCKTIGARVIHLPRREYVTGGAVNLGIRNARGQLILLCSSHAIPVGSYFLESAVFAFDDPQMAAVRCLAASFTDQIARWYKPQDIEYKSLEEQRLAESGTSWLSRYPTAACCVIRRSVWEKIPFDETLEGTDDKLWASEVLKKGYKIRACAEAVYVYARRRSKIGEWNYNNRNLLALYRTKGYIPLTWTAFFLRAFRFAVLTPAAAARYFLYNVIGDFYLVIIPWQAKLPVRRGSVSEYNKFCGAREAAIFFFRVKEFCCRILTRIFVTG